MVVDHALRYSLRISLFTPSSTPEFLKKVLHAQQQEGPEGMLATMSSTIGFILFNCNTQAAGMPAIRGAERCGVAAGAGLPVSLCRPGVAIVASDVVRLGMEEGARIRVRWLDIMPTRHNGIEMFLVRDPEGITDQSLIVSREALFLISLMDGTKSASDLQQALMKASGRLITPDAISSMVDALDAQFLLDNNRYRDRLGALKAEFESGACRSAYLAGGGYPGDEPGLRAFMEDLTRQAQSAAARRDGVKGIVAPHIDYARGMGVYRLAYGSLPRADKTLFVIFGTCHKFAPRLWNIALRDIATPLGTIAGAGEVGRLVRENAFLRPYVDEWPHRNEHSIELATAG